MIGSQSKYPCDYLESIPNLDFKTQVEGAMNRLLDLELGTAVRKVWQHPP